MSATRAGAAAICPIAAGGVDPCRRSDAMREVLLVRLRARVRSWNVSQAQAAARLGLSRPNLNMLLLGRRRFSLDALVDLAEAAGLGVDLTVAPDGPASVGG